VLNFNALQKVFRARFEDGRAHANLSQLSALNNNQIFLNTSRVSYEKMLGKTRHSFFENLFYNKKLTPTLSSFETLNNITNFHYFDFPFLLSAKSDASRYM
jgi:hypothetical protein